ncbi:porin [Burkholderia ubonensis]|uniref:porin n=1 Tax=Burkholderia ubonensis TaxID=101571 RepID=UPI00075D3603|nr:porin [Burkholderia ubonensis]KVX09148.1 porin [Burkholderia ubonensis]KWB38513.1 porin [Burkholderia ubonensis]KWC23341.1 porin [Burkholderia ubonensis]
MRNRVAVATGAILLSSSAFAQSSVTLYGVLDEGLNFTNNVGGEKAYQMSTADLGVSRFGLKGSEDLGGGLHAVFQLDNGFDINSGRLSYGGRLFGYGAYVGLQSDTFGTLTAGRQFDSITDVLGPLTANGNWAGTLFSHPLDNDNTDATFHVSNSVKFTSNTYGGFSGTALYGFSNQAGGFAQNRAFTAGLKYTYDTLTVAGVYANLSSPGTTQVGTVATDDAGFIAGNQKIYGIGANYGIGSATLGLVYTHTNIAQPTGSIWLGDLGLTNASLKYDNIEANAKYDFTPAFSVGGMYTYTRAKLSNGGFNSSLHYNEGGLMAMYYLSKRTTLYAQALYQKASGSSGTVLDNAFIPGSAGLSSNSHQIVGRLAVLHSF